MNSIEYQQAACRPSPNLRISFAAGATVLLFSLALNVANVCAATVAGQLLISEFRLQGPNGTGDEFIEIYNPTASDVVAQASDASAGLGLAASDGILRSTIPNGTTIPAHGHFLIANSGTGGYSLSNYPSGNNGVNATTATPDATYTTGITNNVGIALFNSATTFTPANRLDAVGPTTEANTTYREGTGYTAVATAAVDYSIRRRVDYSSGVLIDTGNNASDFAVEAVNANASLPTASLGAPGPENLTSPISIGPPLDVSLVAPCASADGAPNRIRTGSGNSGTVSIRRKITNNTGGPINRLRFRVVDISTAPAPNGSTAIFSATNSTTVTNLQPCPSGTVTIRGLRLETPPAQALGGGYNSSLSPGDTFDIITLGTPLANGASINVDFLLNVSQDGDSRFLVQTETLPPGHTTFISDALEYGDAPDSYGTLLNSNGARHGRKPDKVFATLRLGAGLDVEMDGQPNASATGDNVSDSGNSNDEDGVTFGAIGPGGSANVTVNASAAAKLDAFVDFNADGDFADAGEKIFHIQAVNPGNNSLQFAVPSNAVPGATFARFRLSSPGGLSFNGFAPDGEVEDYQVMIQSGPMPTSAVSRKVHGTGGPTFDINLPLTGPVGVECRNGGNTHDFQLVVTFPTNVSVPNTPQADVTSGLGDVGSGGIPNGGQITVNGAVVTVPLTNINNAQQIIVTLFGVNDGTGIGDVNIPMGMLLGDTTGEASVNSADISQTKSKSGQAVGASNFRNDVTADNSLNSADISLVKSKSGTALP